MPEILDRFKDVKLPIDGTFTFSTKVRAFPAAQVVWKVKDEPIEASEVAIIEFKKPMTHTLTLKRIPEILNQATVMLAASNVAGEATTQSVLTVTGRAPEFLTKPLKCTLLAGA